MGATDAAFIDTVEAGYRLDGDEETWLERVRHAAEPAFPDVGLGLGAMTSQMDASGWRLRALVGIEDGDWLHRGNAQLGSIWRTGGSVCASLHERLEEVYGDGSVGMFDRLPRPDPRVVDYYGVGATAPTGSAVFLASCCTRLAPKLSPRARARWKRVAAHLHAGLRLRDQLPSERHDDAVIRPDGKVLHAEDRAQTTCAREVLRRAARNIDRARTNLRSRDADEALAIWRALVAGRWSLIDRFDSDGRMFLVARRNEPDVVDPRALTKRERQVVAYAALGYLDKEIAYHLGLGRSTVATHLARARRKLGVSSRVALTELGKLVGESAS